MGMVIDMNRLFSKTNGCLNKCSNPFCLSDAQKRCELQNTEGCEQWGLIFYPKCKQDFENFACCVCNSVCPSGFRDDGAFCAKPSSYGRGVGYPWKFGDPAFDLDPAKKRCEDDYGLDGCEKNGLIWYPKCSANFHAVGCCVCSPDCPSGMADIGVSCAKKSYGRGVGYPWEFNDCQDMGYRDPYIVSEDCEDKLRQL
jgi:hypothetical protein